MILVVAILGIMSTIGLTSYHASLIKSRDIRRKADLDQIKKALRMYYNDHNRYPTPGDLPWGGEFSEGTMVYMKEVPKDPKSKQAYNYSVGSCVDDFRLAAVLEDESDSSIVASHSHCADGCGFTWDTTDKDEYVVCAD